MNKRYKRVRAYTIISYLLAAGLAAVVFVCLVNTEIGYMSSDLESKLSSVMSTIKKDVQDAEELQDKMVDNYKENIRDKTGDALYYIQESGSADIGSEAKRKKLAKLLDVDNIFVMDSAGDYLYGSEPLKSSRLGNKEIKTLVITKEDGVSDVLFELDEETGDGSNAVCSAWYSDDEAIVLEKYPDDFMISLTSTVTWVSVLSRIPFDRGGFVFLLNSDTGDVIYGQGQCPDR